MVGAGYVGLVSSACFAEFGWSVTTIDNNDIKISELLAGKIPIYEPGLDQLVARCTASGNLRFSTDLAAAVSEANVVFLAVGTPSRRGDGYADLRYIFEAIDEITPNLKGFTVIATKSTVPCGTGDRIEKRILELRHDAEVAVCSNPEFLREGSAVNDFLHPDRVLIGCDDARALELMQKIYQPLALRDAPILVTSRRSAELAKYAANAFLAMKVGFINEFSDLCETTGADIQEVARTIGKDGRIGEKFLHPGPGYGGSCFPKDVTAVIRTARDHKTPLTLIEAVSHSNSERKLSMARRVVDAVGGTVSGKTLGVLGVTFKPNTDDMRESPSLTILPILQSEGANLRLYDPQGKAAAIDEGLVGNWCTSAEAVADNADAIILLTEWNEFRALSLRALAARMRGNVFLDFRNVFSPGDAAKAGLKFYGVGRTVRLSSNDLDVNNN